MNPALNSDLVTNDLPPACMLCSVSFVLTKFELSSSELKIVTFVMSDGNLVLHVADIPCDN